MTPLIRDCASEAYAVVSLLSAQSMPMRLSDEKIAGMIGAGAG